MDLSTLDVAAIASQHPPVIPDGLSEAQADELEELIVQWRIDHRSGPMTRVEDLPV